MEMGLAVGRSLPQDVGEKEHLQDKEGVGEALPEGRSPHDTGALTCTHTKENMGQNTTEVGIPLQRRQ